jgi:Putative beta-barrel porin-2, OmpL-like. bbp2
VRKYIFVGSIISAGLSCIGAPAYAMDGPQAVEFDGGPLGPLEFSAAGDGYFFLQSGTSSDPHNSIAGSKAVGAEINAWMTELHKSTGLVQFTIQLGEYQDINLGTNKPSEVNGDRFTTGPLRSAFVSLVPTDNFKLSVGQVPSLVGYESVYPWNNPSALRTVLNVGQNSNSRGVEADYTQGPFSGSVVFGDGYDTGVWNHIQFLATDKIDDNNSVSVYGIVPLGTTGPNTFAYGEGGQPEGGADGNGGQGELAVVNSNMLGAWYTWKIGQLSLTPEVQYQWTTPLTKYANEVSGGLSDDIPKETGNFGAALFGNYKFGDSPYSLAGWAEYATSHGSAAQDAWFVAPDAELAGFAIAPGYQYKQLFTRLNIGYVHLLNAGTPAAGFGDQGMGKNQVVTTLEFAVVY